MTDVVLASLIGAASTALVAIAGSLAVVFGPAWREAREARERRAQEREDKRFSTAEAFLTSFATSRRHDLTETVATRQRFVATLRTEEESIARFTTWLVAAVTEETDVQVKLLYIDRAAELLFASLRGDLSTLQPLPFTPDRSVLDAGAPGQRAGDLF